MDSLYWSLHMKLPRLACRFLPIFKVFLCAIYSFLYCFRHLWRHLCGHLGCTKTSIQDGVSSLSGIQVSPSGVQICWRLRRWLEWEDDSLPFGPLPLYWLQHPLSHNCLNEPSLLSYTWGGWHTHTHSHTCAHPLPRGLLSFLVTSAYWNTAPKYRRWNNGMSSLSRHAITLIVCFLFCHLLLCGGAQLLLMRIGTNIAFISH